MPVLRSFWDHLKLPRYGIYLPVIFLIFLWLHPAVGASGFSDAAAEQCQWLDKNFVIYAVPDSAPSRNQSGDSRWMLTLGKVDASQTKSFSDCPDMDSIFSDIHKFNVINGYFVTEFYSDSYGVVRLDPQITPDPVYFTNYQEMLPWLQKHGVPTAPALLTYEKYCELAPRPGILSSLAFRYLAGILLFLALVTASALWISKKQRATQGLQKQKN